MIQTTQRFDLPIQAKVCLPMILGNMRADESFPQTTMHGVRLQVVSDSPY